ncbi:hypothetical protein N7G274_010237 [Stereocaulon virgatum]|uniref:Uncharacterized protein n=1 Tax=Stereocaulon virgatum TaxID=373712 RepID=A0ABR3ZTU0_9LECA
MGRLLTSLADMPPKSKPAAAAAAAAAAAGLVPDSIYRPLLAPKLARMADLRARYARVAEVLLPALEELRARTAQNLEDDDHWHLSGPNHEHYRRFKAGYDAHLQRKIDLITATNTQKMENEAAKTGFAQQTVRNAYGVSSIVGISDGFNG